MGNGRRKKIHFSKIYSFKCGNGKVDFKEEHSQIGGPGFSRVVFVNEKIGEDASLRTYADNYVSTTKYTLASFFPKSLYEQFRRVANFYFLVTGILAFTPLAPYGVVNAVLPLVVIISASMVKEGIEDWKRKQQGCKPAVSMDFAGGSTSVSQGSSFLPSSGTSYNPSPASSSFPSPGSSAFTTNVDGNSLIPWLKNLSSGSSSASSSRFPHLYIHGGSISAPVTPPLSSPTGRTPSLKRVWDGPHYALFPSSTPPSPGRHVLPDSDPLSRIQIPLSGPNSPTYTLVASNPFGFRMEDLVLSRSRMSTPVQSGTCSPAIAAGVDNTADIPMADAASYEFAFGGSAAGLVKPWEGERIHEECGPDDLELTLGTSKTR